MNGLANNYNIPDGLEEEVRKRDTRCVYCGIKMKAHPHRKGTPHDKATFEHIDNNGPSDDKRNIAMCCAACNSSKSKKKLLDWFESPYCKEKRINKKRVASIVRGYIKHLNSRMAAKGR